MSEKLRERVEILEHLPWVDPALASAMSSDKVPAAPTSGPPHRLTIYVPVSPHWTILSLGEEHADHDFGNGIFFRTREQIHWETTHSYICMGGPSPLIGWGVDTVPASSQGYSLVTKHDAYHHADLQHLLTSTDGDMIVRTKAAKTAVLQSDSGITEVNSGGHVRINASNKVLISAGDGFAPETGHTYQRDNGVPWPQVSHQTSAGAVAGKIAKGASMAQTAVATLSSLIGGHRKAHDTEAGVSESRLLALAKAMLNGAKLLAAYQSFSGAGESVKGSASGGIGIWGNRNATVYGSVIGSIGSLGYTMLGAATADVKGYCTAGVWGGRQAVLFADLGTCAVGSHFNTTSVGAGDVTSFVADGGLMIVADAKPATFRGSNRCAVYGGSKAYLGCGSGYGLVVTAGALEIGKLGTAKPFNSASVARSHGVYINKNFILAVWKKSKLACAKDHALLRYKKAGIKLHSGGLSAKAGNINLDA